MGVFFGCIIAGVILWMCYCRCLIVGMLLGVEYVIVGELLWVSYYA